MLVSCIFKVNM